MKRFYGTKVRLSSCFDDLEQDEIKNLESFFSSSCQERFGHKLGRNGRFLVNFWVYVINGKRINSKSN